MFCGLYIHKMVFQLQAESDMAGTELHLPWTYRKAINFMQLRSLSYNTLKFNQSFPNVFEVI